MLTKERIREHVQASEEVRIDAQGRIIVTLAGRQTAAAVRKLRSKIEELVHERHVKGKKALILYDARALGVMDITTGSRVEGRKLLEVPVEANAILSNRYIASIVSYVIRASGHAERSRVFRKEADALNWLDKTQQPLVKDNTLVQRCIGIGIALLGILVLFGWQTDNLYLTRWITTLRPMNPVSAVGLVILGSALFALRDRRWKRFLLVCSGLLVMLGALALLPFHIDTLLYGAHVRAAGPHTDISDLAAICFILCGSAIWSFSRTQRPMRVAHYIIVFCIIAVALFNFYGLLYAQEFMYQISSHFAMALNLAAGFVVAGLTFLFLTIEKDARRLLGLITYTGWLIIAVFLLTQWSTYQSWSTAMMHNNQYAAQAFHTRIGNVNDVVQPRLQAYTDALRGFRGFFAASDYVQQGEFQAYFNSLNLPETYPGIRAVTFIARVNDTDLPNFAALRRNDTSLYPRGNPDFAIIDKAEGSTHYIVAYNATASGAGLGTDLAATPSRAEAFQAAQAANDSVTSVPVTFNGTNGNSPQIGFFVTTPVYGKTNSKTPVGFVNAVFTYDDLLSAMFAHNDLLEGLHLTIIQDGRKVFTSTKTQGEQTLSTTYGIPVAGRTWQFRITAASNFGLNPSQQRLPGAVLFFGQLVDVLIAIIFFMQVRSRRRALALAESITEDLKYERNLAVANDRKSSAILKSIGDAVFAIDIKERITLFNPVAEKISGYSRDEALGKPYHEVLHFELEKDGSTNSHFIRRALVGHSTSMANHTVLVCKDGKRVPVADSAAPIVDSRGRVTGAIVVFHDVTTEYQLDKAKSEFVTLASHQLRTPISSISWLAEMLLAGDAGPLSKEQRTYIEQLYASNQRSIDMVDAMLMVSSLDLGPITVRPEPIKLAALIKMLVVWQQQRFTGEKTLHIHESYAPDVPELSVDPDLMRNILGSLLNNAFKYTPDGGEVSVSIELSPVKLSPKSRGSVVITIKDTGYGIPTLEQDKLFAKLFRSSNIKKKDTDGTGLGLFIVKKILEQVGGTIQFQSTENKGSTFSVLLPLEGMRPHA